jgi:hypothetical protein
MRGLGDGQGLEIVYRDPGAAHRPTAPVLYMSKDIPRIAAVKPGADNG